MGNSGSTIRLVTHRGPEEFMAHAGSFLLAHEAENNLTIGIANGIAAGRDVAGGVALSKAPQFTVVEQDGRVVMTAVRTPPHSLLVSRGPRSVAGSVAAQLASMDKYPGVRGHASMARPVVEGIARVSGQSVRSATQQRIYGIYSVQEIASPKGRFRAATSAELKLLAEWQDAFATELTPGVPAGNSEHVVQARILSARCVRVGGQRSRVAGDAQAGHSQRSAHRSRIHASWLQEPRVCDGLRGCAESADSGRGLCLRMPLRRPGEREVSVHL